MKESNDYNDKNCYEEGDNDEDLQAALALSMCDADAVTVTNEEGSNHHHPEKVERPTLQLAPPPTPPPLSSTQRGNSILSVNENGTHNKISKATGAQLQYTKVNVHRFDCQSFQKLMWEDNCKIATTTIDDKQRWINECFQLRGRQSAVNDETKSEQVAAATKSVALHYDGMIASENNIFALDDEDSESNPKTPLDIFTGFRISSKHHQPPRPRQLSQPILWGLTQTHGGPCGVLAAVQAEMIRILLFGRRPAAAEGTECDGGCYDDNIQVRGSGGGERQRSQRQLSNTLYYPFDVSTSTSASTSCVCPPITEREVIDSMAMAIGMILARAALAPCTTNASSCLSESSSAMRTDHPPLHMNNRHNVQIVLPRGTCPNHLPSSTKVERGIASTTKTSTTWLQELLCTPPIAQSTACDCSAGSQSTITSSHYLLLHTIGVAGAEATTDNSRDHGVPLATFRQIDDDNESHDPKLPEMKRHRSSSCTKINIMNQGEDMLLIDNNYGKLMNSTSSLPSCEQGDVTALATAVANFLIRESRHDDVSSIEKEMERTDECVDSNNTSTGNDSTSSSSSSSSPLEFFQKPGGVMFLVMSLVATRGIEKIRADMDDPNTSLTSNFGHSSQELMNLLLTGRAVSNVFDNSMVLSDELTCHGIQSRPAIGYLSILESLRYCEVGGYYKSPSFPIWIVGSTSHFTVLFGDEQCLIESKSDLLLEKCRRSFQKVEDGNGENGFIPVDKLGDVLDELDLTSKVGGINGVETLRAYLEVSGAGIILWDDFWKACSRLMSGSSLEVIMSGQDHLMRDNNDDFRLDMIDGGIDFESSDVWASLIPELRPSFNLDKSLIRPSVRDRDPFKQDVNQYDVTNEKMPAVASHDHEEIARSCESDYIIAQNITAELNPEMGIMTTPADRNRTLLMQHVNQEDEMNQKMPAATASQSDEELARRLAAEWGSLPDQQEEEVVDLGMKSDEDYARKLQAMWDAEVTTGRATSAFDVSSHVATTDDVESLSSDGSPIGASLLEGTMMDSDSKQNTKKSANERIIAATNNNDETAGDQSQQYSTRQHIDLERHGPSFPLFHYNGLRGGKITCFRVQKLSPTEAVGASIASSSKGGGGNGARGCGLEDVVRTKWPSCLVNWFGEDPPSID